MKSKNIQVIPSVSEGRNDRAGDSGIAPTKKEKRGFPRFSCQPVKKLVFDSSGRGHESRQDKQLPLVGVQVVR